MSCHCPLLQALSESFSGDIPDEHMTSNSFFPDEYFTCSSLCLSCGWVCLWLWSFVVKLTKGRNRTRKTNRTENMSGNWALSDGLQQFEMFMDLCHFILIINTCLKSLSKSRSWDIPSVFLFVFSSGCKRSMNHLKEGLDHEAKHRCRYSAQYDNRIYTCKASTNPHNALMWMFITGLARMFWVSVLNLSGLLWGRERGDCSSQNNGFVWLPLVWLGHLCLVWVSRNEYRDDRNSSLLSQIILFILIC